MQDDVKSLSHSKWRCKYHIVFAPKYRRQIIYGKIKADVGRILRELSQRKGVQIIEAECCPDHIHMLVEIPPHMSVSEYMGYLKSKSSLMIFDRHANLKYKYGNRHFWCRGYYVDTVGKYDMGAKIAIPTHWGLFKKFKLDKDTPERFVTEAEKRGVRAEILQIYGSVDTADLLGN